GRQQRVETRRARQVCSTQRIRGVVLPVESARRVLDGTLTAREREAGNVSEPQYFMPVLEAWSFPGPRFVPMHQRQSRMKNRLTTWSCILVCIFSVQQAAAEGPVTIGGVEYASVDPGPAFVEEP